MSPASRDGQMGIFDAEKFQLLKSSKELFNQTMARHLLGNMVALLVERSAVNLDCLNEISRMSLDDAKRLLSNCPQTNRRILPVAHSFLTCADDAMVEQIFTSAQKLALNYVTDCIQLNTNQGEE